jgi:sulfur carrier protein ThiS
LRGSRRRSNGKKGLPEGPFDAATRGARDRFRARRERAGEGTKNRGKSRNDMPLTTLKVLCYEFAMRVEWEGKVQLVDKRTTVRRLLDMYALSTEAHLVTVNGVLATEDRMLERDDSVKIIRVISGG